MLRIKDINKPGTRQSRGVNHEGRLLFAPSDPATTSPFLILGEEWFAPPAGFPSHPHRGLETVTFVLDTATSEAAARASIYMYSLSGSLIAMGLNAQSGAMPTVLVACILPTIVVLGLFTIARLVDISIDELSARMAISRIHAWYATQGSVAARQFGSTGHASEVARVSALRFGPVMGGLTTIASMVATINSFVAGVTVAVFAVQGLHLSITAAVEIASAVVITFVVVFHVYQSYRLRDAIETNLPHVETVSR